MYLSQHRCCLYDLPVIFFYPWFYWKCIRNEPNFFPLYHFQDNYSLRSKSIQHLKSRGKVPSYSECPAFGEMDSYEVLTYFLQNPVGMCPLQTQSPSALVPVVCGCTEPLFLTLTLICSNKKQHAQDIFPLGEEPHQTSGSPVIRNKKQPRNSTKEPTGAEHMFSPNERS